MTIREFAAPRAIRSFHFKPNFQCRLLADFVAKVGCCRRVVGDFAKSERL
jgi:hypothetical protein